MFFGALEGRDTENHNPFQMLAGRETMSSTLLTAQTSVM